MIVVFGPGATKAVAFMEKMVAWWLMGFSSSLLKLLRIRDSIAKAMNLPDELAAFKHFKGPAHEDKEVSLGAPPSKF